jgi:hypothetical protein
MESQETCCSLPEIVGFLSVSQLEGAGFCGGYLLLNASARPVEFHCTLPVNPDRAQHILYGTSLESFLFSEQIGRPLVEKSKLSPGIVFVEQAPLLAIQELSRAPVFHIWREHQPDVDNNPAIGRCGDDAPPTIAWRGVDSGYETAAGRFVRALDARIDLMEPFGRIREALLEAHSVRAA